MNDVTVGRQRETVVVARDVPAYYWRCELCGRLGTGLLSVLAAQQEAGRHAEETHGLQSAVVQRVDWGAAPFVFDDEIAARDVGGDSPAEPEKT